MRAAAQRHQPQPLAQHQRAAVRLREELLAQAPPQVVEPQAPERQQAVRVEELGELPALVGPKRPSPRSVRRRKYQPTAVASLRS